MYTQALNSSDGDDRGVEDVARAAQFQARIDADERIEIGRASCRERV